MLSNLTILILAVMTPILSVFCFIKGYNIGAKETGKPEIKVETPKQKIERAKENKKAAENRRRLNTLLENIENYDGSSKGQKEL
uniref:Uncharacterized protein n=1 Tax=Podoviridae sp. ctoqT5 TaxID=2826577 RepID=A0A8S5MQ04_9CAUD|nr:MAG TPA: hypothetical protein [Podoviridae sp. ctoqT5]